MPGEYLPPVTAEFKADIADIMAKLAALRAELEALAVSSREASNRMASDFRNMADDIAKPVEQGEARAHRATQDEADFSERIHRQLADAADGRRSAAQLGEEALQRAMDDTAVHAENAGNRIRRDMDSTAGHAAEAGARTGRSWISNFAASIAGGGVGGIINNLANVKVPMPGGRYGANTPIGGVAAGLITAGPMLAGLAEPLTAGVAGLGPGAVATAAMLLPMKDAMQEVTASANAMEGSITKYNEAATLTAQATADGTIKLQGFNGAQTEALQLLGTQNVTWGQLTATQKDAYISLRENNSSWKELTQSQKDGINALLAEKAAYDKLEPAQQQALTNYQAMHKVYDDLRSASMPSMFTAISAAEQAATDILKPMLPLIEAAAAGWTKVFERLDAGANSLGYQRFMADMTGHAASSIDTWATATGNLAGGLGKMMEVVVESGDGDKFNAWLLASTSRFTAWAGSAKGSDDISRFMARVMANGPSTWEILGNLTKTIGNLLSIFTANYGTLQLINLMSLALLKFTSNPVGRFAIELIALSLALARVADALKLVMLAQAGVAAIQALAGGGGIGGALSAANAVRLSAGRGAASAANAASTGAAVEALGGGAAGAAEGAAGAGAAGGAASAGVGLAAGAAGIAAAAALVIGGIALYTERLHNASMQAQGVINADGNKLGAATKVDGVTVSQGFRDMANAVAASAQGTKKVYTTTGVMVMGAGQTYTESFQKNNDALKTVMNLGKMEFGQAAGVFVNQMGGDTLKLATQVKASGKTLDQEVQKSLTDIFNNASAAMPGHTAALNKAFTEASAQAFAQMQQTTKTDYNDLGTAVKQYEDDLKNGRSDKAQQDTQQLMAAMQKNEGDYTNGRIDTTNKLTQKQMQDVLKFYTDQTAGNTLGMQADIKKLWQDSQAAYTASANLAQAAQIAADNRMWDALNKATVGATTAAEAQAEAALATALAKAQAYAKQQNISIGTGTPGSGHGITFAGGGLATGPGGPRDDLIPANLSNGEFVVNAAATARHLPLLQALNRKGFADGGLASPSIDLAIWSGMEDNKIVLAQKAQIAQNVYSALQQAAAAAAAASAGGGAATPAQVAAWIHTGLQDVGRDNAAWFNGISTIAMNESGGNPTIVNTYDINAQEGHPSMGLLQFIQPTFDQYAAPGHKNILNPIDQVIADARPGGYIDSAYGGIGGVPGVASIASGGGYKPYDTGGVLHSGTGAVNLSGRPERVLTDSQWASMAALARAGAAQAAANSVTVPLVVMLDSKVIYSAMRTIGYQKQRRNAGSQWEFDHEGGPR